MFDRVAKLRENSVVFVISRWPYTTATVEVAEYAHSKGHFIILLTNNLTCTISEVADVTLLTPKEENRYSIVPFVTVIEALVDEICHRKAQYTMEKIHEIDDVLQKRDIVRW